MKISPITFVIYFLLEVLTFYLVARLIGVGWALIAFFACILVGLVLAAVEMSSIARRVLSNPGNPGAALGDYSLAILGSLFIAIPGFLSTIVGLLCVFPPTRVVIRKIIAHKIYVRIQEFSDAALASTARYTARNKPGNFGTFIDE